jgi:hypothetical protein
VERRKLRPAQRRQRVLRFRATMTRTRYPTGTVTRSLDDQIDDPVAE